VTPANAGGGPTLDLRADGIGPIVVGAPVSEDSVRAALPGYDVKYEEASYEDVPVPRLVVTQDGGTAFWITPEGGKVAAIVVMSPADSSAIGINVGSTYAAVVDAVGALDCEVGYDDDTFAFQPICTAAGAPDVSIVFADIELPEDIGPGEEIPADRVAALLHGAVVDAIVL